MNNEEKLKMSNERLAEILKSDGITNFRMTSVGNSIASGYSMVGRIIPLLYRNNSIKDVMNENDISLDVHHFARAQNNNDEHVFEWLEGNITEDKIFKLNRNDYGDTFLAQPHHGLDDEKMNEYYPLDRDKYYGLKDLILENDPNLFNTVIYNGGTGSFLDAATRGGMPYSQGVYGLVRDASNIESSLRLIQSNNRLNGNTQVYLCGAPDYLGTKFTNLLNYRLKNISKKYANVTYVSPAVCKVFYHSYDDPSKLAIDGHYSEDEYIEFNNNIINAINDNYRINKALIEVDRLFYSVNGFVESSGRKIGSNDDLSDSTSKLIDKELDTLNDDERIKFLKMLKKYINHRTPYDYYYLSDGIKDSINKEIKALKK